MDRQIPKGDSFSLSRDFSVLSFLFLLYGPQVDLFFYFPFFLLACRMERGNEEVSTSQVRSRRGTPRETSTTSNLVIVMSAKELRLYSQIPAEISLKTSDNMVTATIGEVENAIYFTRE